MKITCISDTHAYHHITQIEPCDVLVHAGDYSTMGGLREISSLFDWFDRQPCNHVVTCCGNHDFGIQNHPDVFNQEILEPVSGKIHYLELASYYFPGSVTIEGVTFTGSPWTPYYFNWAFNFPRRDINSHEIAKAHWDLIPQETNVLLTHGPPYSILDKTEDGRYVGCPALNERILELSDLKAHVFGHIHKSYGQVTLGDVLYVNASQKDIDYRSHNRPFTFTLGEDESLET